MGVTANYERLVSEGTLKPDAAQRALLPELERIAEGLAVPSRKGWFAKAREPVKGLYIWGGVGRGKSMVMDLFVESLEDIPVRRVHFHAFMQEIQSALHEARKTGVDDAIAPVAADVAAGLRVLAFDEMQITDIADAMIVGRLFEKLFAAGVTVVTTSNRPPADLYKDGLNRQLFLPFIELISTRLTVWEMASDTDYRQDRLADETVYFTPNGPEARAAIQGIWEDLAGGAEPLTLMVKGREVTIPAFRNGVGRTHFHGLCGQPLGPADYLAVAQALRVLILENIPQLGRSNFNEAKRFVTLIDALYEARVRLIASAAAVPEMLYVEGAGSFEFERTASRLREMQAADWGE
ncbi:MAG: cell division protein ZapE [Pseudomonadota bacterium]